MILQNTGKHLRDYLESEPRRSQFDLSAEWELRSHKTNFVQNDGSVKEHIKICTWKEGISETVSICFTSLSLCLSCSM